MFEKKLEEVLNFQRLSHSRANGQNEDQVFDIFLESSVSAVLATGGWLEVLDETGGTKDYMLHNLDMETVRSLKEGLDGARVKRVLSNVTQQNYGTNRFIASIDDLVYKEVLIYPLYAQETKIAVLVLLKDVQDSFNKEMVEIIHTFASQAEVSIENIRLMNEAITHERL